MRGTTGPKVKPLLQRIFYDNIHRANCPKSERATQRIAVKLRTAETPNRANRKQNESKERDADPGMAFLFAPGLVYMEEKGRNARAPKRRRLEVRSQHDKGAPQAVSPFADWIPPEIQSMILLFAVNDEDPCTYAVCRFVCSTWKSILPPRPLLSIATCSAAARRGQLNLLQWARANGCPWGPTSGSGARKGGSLRAQRHATGMCYPGYEHTSGEAARGGHIELLKWARREGCPLDESMCIWAAEGGHLETLAWARSEGCHWNSLTSAYAARYGWLEVLKWLRENGCPWDSGVCNAAARGGHLDVLKWLRKRGCPWDQATCESAAVTGQIDILRWARENGCPWNGAVCCSAAKGGHLDVLKWARENGCPWNEWTCALAAGEGHTEVLKWAKENGCPWSALTCIHAAEAGNMEALRWAIENGCPVNQKLFGRAAEFGRIDVLEFAKGAKGGIFWNDDLCTRAASGSQFAALEWLLDNGCPWSDSILPHIRGRFNSDPMCPNPEGAYPRIMGIIRSAAGHDAAI